MFFFVCGREGHPFIFSLLLFFQMSLHWYNDPFAIDQISKRNNGIEWKSIIEIYSKETTQRLHTYKIVAQIFKYDWNKIQRNCTDCEHIRAMNEWMKLANENSRWNDTKGSLKLAREFDEKLYGRHWLSNKENEQVR